MYRFLGLALVACVVALAACGGGDDLSASDIEARLMEPTPLDDDPVVEAECPEGLESGGDDVVTCTTTTESGAVSEVDVQSPSEDSLTFNSVQVGADSGDEPKGNPKDVARLERKIAKAHDPTVGDDPSRKATGVECPDDFVERTGARTSCMVTLADGSVITYQVRVTADQVAYHPDPMPSDILANYIREHWNGQNPRLKAKDVECPEALPVVKGSTTTCELTRVDGVTHDTVITMDNANADFSIDYRTGG